MLNKYLILVDKSNIRNAQTLFLPDSISMDKLISCSKPLFKRCGLYIWLSEGADVLQLYVSFDLDDSLISSYPVAVE